MSSLIAAADLTSTSNESRIGFATEGDENWPEWDRFITLDGKKAYYIGNICETCAFLFERLDGANDRVAPTELSKTLKDGIARLDEEALRMVAGALAEGAHGECSIFRREQWWIPLQEQLQVLRLTITILHPKEQRPLLGDPGTEVRLGPLSLRMTAH